jgi:hypothetical protein
MMRLAWLTGELSGARLFARPLQCRVRSGQLSHAPPPKKTISTRRFPLTICQRVKKSATIIMVDVLLASELIISASLEKYPKGELDDEGLH